MMRLTYWLVLAFTLLTFQLVAQHPEYDSLVRLLGEAKDTTKIRALVRLGQITRGSNMEESESYFVQANEAALKIKDWKGVGRALHGLGVTYGMQGDYARALDEFELALKINLDNKLMGAAADIYSGMGIVYRRLGNYPLSLEYYQKSFHLYDSLADINGILAVYNNLGIVYDLMKEPDRAVEVYNSALNMHDSLGIDRGQTLLLNNLALIHHGKKEYEEALNLLQRTIDMTAKLGQKQQQISPLVNIGNIHYHMGNYLQAEKILMEAFELADEFGDKESIANIKYNIINISLARGDKHKALEFADSYLESVKEIGSIRLYSIAYELMGRVWEDQGDMALALKYQKLYNQYKDSLFNDEKVRQYKAQQALFDFQEKNKELLRQQAEIKVLEERVRWEKRWIILLLTVVVLILVSVFLLYQKNRARQRMNQLLQNKNQLIYTQKQKIEEINHELEKRMLRAQMNPHFIFNAINSIQHFITANDKISALKFLNKFSTLLRQVLETSTEVNVLLSEEIRLLELYIQLESLRFDDCFSYSIEIDSELDTNQFEIPILLVQPFVENAILHGLLNKNGTRQLLIRFEDQDGFIRCIVQDNGVGRAAATQEKNRRAQGQESRGLSVTEQRLALLEKNLDYKTMVVFEDLKDAQGHVAGTKVIIHIPKTLNN